MDTAIQVQASDLLNAEALKRVERVAKERGVSLTMAMVFILNSYDESITSPATQAPAPAPAQRKATPAVDKSISDGEDMANVSMDVFKGNSRAFNALEKHGVRSPKELEGWTEEQLRGLKGCGDKVVTYIKEVMSELGLSLASDDLSSKGELQAPEARPAPTKVKSVEQPSRPIKVEEDEEEEEDEAPVNFYADTILLGHGVDRETPEFNTSLGSAVNNYAMAWDLSLKSAKEELKGLFKDGMSGLSVDTIFETIALAMPMTEVTKSKIEDKFDKDFVDSLMRTTYGGIEFESLSEGDARHMLSLSPPESSDEEDDSGDDEWDSAFGAEIF